MPITFATNAQFLTRYDARWVGKNMLDDGTAASAASLADTSSTAGSRLQTMIQEASEIIMAAAAVGARYAVADLVTYGGQLLVRITCDLTMGLVLKRRGRAVTDESQLSGPYAEALGYLEQLRRGERVFYAVPEVPEAGLPGTTNMNPIPGIQPALITSGAFRLLGTAPGTLNNPYPPG